LMGAMFLILKCGNLLDLHTEVWDAVNPSLIEWSCDFPS
jgi:hypothetical protein